MSQETQTIPVDAIVFEDIIDGYFPLQESLRQMLVRNGFASACITLTHVPIMDIPGLAPDAPVPLRLTRGTAGIADKLEIIATLGGFEPKVSGTGKWRWYSDKKAQETRLSPLIRLAEPAIVQGIGIRVGTTNTQCFGQVAILQKSDFVIYQGPGPDLRKTPNVILWAKHSQSNKIHNEVDLHVHGLFNATAREFKDNAKHHQTSAFSGPKFTEILMLNDPPQFIRV